MAWNRPDLITNSRQPQDTHRNYRLLIMLVCCVATLIVIVFCIFLCAKKPIASSNNTIRKHSHAAIENSNRIKNHDYVIEKTSDAVTTNQLEKYQGVPIKRRTVVTNGNGFVIERILTVDGKSHRVTHYPKSPFVHPTDQYIASIVSRRPGSLTPLPNLKNERGLEKAFYESLKTDIVIQNSDSDKLKELKARVITAREDVARLLKEGMTFAEVLTEHQKISNENADIRQDANRELRQIISDGDLKAARDYIRKINLAFQQMGIEELKIPSEIREKEK